MGLFYIIERIGDIGTGDLKSGDRHGIKAGRSPHLVSGVLFFFIPIDNSYLISICDLLNAITSYEEQGFLQAAGWSLGVYINATVHQLP